MTKTTESQRMKAIYDGQIKLMKRNCTCREDALMAAHICFGLAFICLQNALGDNPETIRDAAVTAVNYHLKKLQL